MKRNILFFIGFLLLIIISGCAKSIGETCKTNDECVTKNCKNSICAQSELGGYCKEDYHCLQGICKNNICALGQKGDSCKSNIDCEQSKFECYKGNCVSKAWYCKIARFTNLAGNSLFLGIILLIIGAVGIYFGKNIIVANVAIGSIVIGLSAFLVASAIAVFGIGIFATCF